MIILTTHNYTLLFSFLMLSMSSSFFILFLYTVSAGSVTITIQTFTMMQQHLDLSILLTPMSMIFSTTVTIISMTSFLFMPTYFQSSKTLVYFNWYTFMFIMSMLILINFNDFFFVMLGWDGLGITSFLLILYYQSPTSTSSATITILMNRLGDCLLVIFILLLSMSSMNTHFMLDSTLMNTFLLPLLFLALSTKSALFPFSPWLPAAMAAPTPISSLVHSSTLVTAGLFLLIQNSSILANSSLSLFMLISSIFTSFYAGISSLLESDLKKVVALSTLSHLGFIGMSISLSLPHLAFFHLITHAFFKSSLFMSLGSFIISHNHYQDSRTLSSLSNYNPFFTTIVLVSEANLLGLPFLSGFYSKDLILELSQYSSLGTILMIFMYLNVILTFSYSYRLLLSLTTPPSQSPFFLSSLNMQPTSTSFIFMLSLLSLSSMIAGFFFSKLLLHSEITIPVSLKMLPAILLIVVFPLIMFSSPFQVSKSSPVMYFFSSMLFLFPVWSNYTTHIFLNYSRKIVMMEESFMKSSLLTLTSYMFSSYSYIATTMYMTSIKTSAMVFIFMALILATQM